MAWACCGEVAANTSESREALRSTVTPVLEIRGEGLFQVMQVLLGELRCGIFQQKQGAAAMFTAIACEHGFHAVFKADFVGESRAGIDAEGIHCRPERFRAERVFFRTEYFPMLWQISLQWRHWRGIGLLPQSSKEILQAIGLCGRRKFRLHHEVANQELSDGIVSRRVLADSKVLHSRSQKEGVKLIGAAWIMQHKCAQGDFAVAAAERAFFDAFQARLFQYAVAIRPLCPIRAQVLNIQLFGGSFRLPRSELAGQHGGVRGQAGRAKDHGKCEGKKSAMHTCSVY